MPYVNPKYFLIFGFLIIFTFGMSTAHAMMPEDYEKTQNKFGIKLDRRIRSEDIRFIHLFGPAMCWPDNIKIKLYNVKFNFDEDSFNVTRTSISRVAPTFGTGIMIYSLFETIIGGISKLFNKKENTANTNGRSYRNTNNPVSIIVSPSAYSSRIRG